jgi:hypothetical protein
MAVLGVAPFSAFIGYEVPRLLSGEAFSFIDLPSQSAFVMSRNFSITGLGARLRLLELANPTRVQLAWLAWAFTLLVLWLAMRRREEGTRAFRLVGWLALLNLAALRAPAAPSAYVVVPALWMLALVASDASGRWWWALGVALAWVVVQGPPPLPNRIDLVVSGIGQAVLVAICAWGILRRAPMPRSATEMNAPVGAGARALVRA